MFTNDIFGTSPTTAVLAVVFAVFTVMMFWMARQ